MAGQDRECATRAKQMAYRTMWIDSRKPLSMTGRNRWLTVRDAASVLSVSPDALRRAFERHARSAPDGGTEAEVDGVRARKFGRQWRVMLGNAWQI